MAEDIVMSFGSVQGYRAQEVTCGLGSLLALAGGELDRCDIGFRRHARGVVALVHLAGEPDDALIARLAFWTARAGGAAVVLSEMTEGVRANIAEVLERSDVRIAVARDAISEGLAAFVAAAGIDPPPEDVVRPPVLRLDVGGPGWSAVTYDPLARQLFIPSPLCPPVGDEFDAAVRVAGREGLLVTGRLRTIAARDPFMAAEGTPAGFVVRVERDSRLRAVLMQVCRRDHGLGGRTAPRYQVAGRARVTADPPASAPAPEQYIANLSHRGAFIRTSSTYSRGTAVRVEIRLPHGDSVELPATVVHQKSEGMGVEFGDDAAARARLDATITELVGARRQILVIDDDELVRRTLADALEERGLHVVAEPDAIAGLQRLAEDLFMLDLLVTDVMMPGIDGEELIRRIRQVGGERDLPILAVTASLDGALRERLRLAGADAAVSKTAGPAGIADAVEALLRSRTAPRDPRQDERAGEAAGELARARP